MGDNKCGHWRRGANISWNLGFQPPGLRLPCSSSAPGMFLSCAREKPNPFVSMDLSSQSFSGVNTAELEPHRAINQMELCHQREDGLKGGSSLLPFPALVLLSHLPKKRFCRVCISQFIFTSFASLVSFGSPASLEALGAGEEQR